MIYIQIGIQVFECFVDVDIGVCIQDLFFSQIKKNNKIIMSLIKFSVKFSWGYFLCVS